MANRLRSVKVTPTSTKSGKKVSVRVGYDSNVDKALLITSSPAFEITPTSIDCVRGVDGVVEFELTITRADNVAPKTCRLLFGLFGDERVRLVEVT
jgi:hypothetical protein